MASRLSYTFHIQCARLYEQIWPWRTRSAHSHWQKADEIREKLPSGQADVQVSTERAIYSCCRVLLWLEYAYIIASGRGDQMD